jgi:hypothetical protein
MSSVSELCPSLPIRISRAQLLLLLSSLRPVVCASLSLVYRTDDVNPEHVTEQPSGFHVFHDPLIRLWQRLNLLAEREQQRYRTQLDAFEAAMCGLALRAAGKRERSEKSSAGSQAASRRSELMRTIENHRKRAGRKFKLTVGADAAAEAAMLLREYEMRLRPKSLPKWLKFRAPFKYRKVWINKLVGYATERLLEGCPPIPPATEIRRLVRLFVRYVRRGRYQFSLRKLTEDKESAMPVLAAFILQRWNGDDPAEVGEEQSRPLGHPHAASA